MRRPPVVGVVVTVALVLALGTAGVASAAWSTAGSGTSTAQGGTLATPTVTASAVTCQNLKQQATLSWPAITGAAAYDVWITASGSGATQTTSTTRTSTTLSAGLLSSGNIVTTTYSVRVRATAGNWAGTWSPTKTVTLGACLF